MMESGEAKTNATTGTSVSSNDQSVDKNNLFSNLLKIQYPMAQDMPLQQQGNNDDIKKSYHERMDELIRKYENEL